MLAISKHLCGCATDYTLRCLVKSFDLRSSSSSPPPPSPASTTTTSSTLRGIAIATCCHHRCTWSTYISKFSYNDFDLQSFVNDGSINNSIPNTRVFPKDQPFFEKHGFTPLEFAYLCKMAPWATSLARACAVKDQSNKDDGDEDDADEECEHESEEDDEGNNEEVDEHKVMVKKHKSESSNHSNSNEVLSPQERKELGMKCKRLLDHGRMEYLIQQGLVSKLLVYIDSKITPENTMLLAITPNNPHLLKI